jgi:hypothetical protein
MPRARRQSAPPPWPRRSSLSDAHWHAEASEEEHGQWPGTAAPPQPKGVTPSGAKARRRPSCRWGHHQEHGRAIARSGQRRGAVSSCAGMREGCWVVPSWRGSFFFFFFNPRQRRQKKSLMRGEWPARWEPQEEGVMSIAASFPSVKKPRFMSVRREKQTMWVKVMLASLWQLRTIYIWRLVQALLASCNVEPTHNTTKNFAPNLRWGCQSHRFAVNKGMSVSSGKQ